MKNAPKKPTKTDKRAAALRENLKKRKAAAASATQKEALKK